jgi:3-oxoacyl-[acyl-carrier-protein] synthase-3
MARAMNGIVDFDLSYPSARAEVSSMHAACGVPVDDILQITHCDSFPVLGDDERSWELALDAARAVMRRSGVDPAAIAQVIYAGAGEWETPFWSPAAKVAHELGIERAHCFEVANFCNAGMAAAQIALDRMARNETARDGSGREHGGYALVLLGDRLSRMVDYADPQAKALFNFGDAGGAMLLGGGEHCSFALLHSAMRTDPSWSDYYFGERRDGRIVIRRGEHRKGLAAAYVDNFVGLLDDTLKALDLTIDDFAYLLINHGDKSMHERLLAAIGLPREKSVFNYHRLAHMGSADTLIALRDLVDARRLVRGDRVLLATSAMGFSWGITALECRQ